MGKRLSLVETRNNLEKICKKDFKSLRDLFPFKHFRSIHNGSRFDNLYLIPRNCETYYIYKFKKKARKVGV
jgi:hypothetical protein